jgi:hypothetical protein
MYRFTNANTGHVCCESSNPAHLCSACQTRLHAQQQTTVPAPRSLADTIPVTPIGPTPTGAFLEWLNQPRPLADANLQPRVAANVTTVPSPPKDALLVAVLERRAMQERSRG